MNNNLFKINEQDIQRKESALKTILSDMNLPINRISVLSLSNLRWLTRNISIENSKHPLHEVATSMVTWLINHKV